MRTNEPLFRRRSGTTWASASQAALGASTSTAWNSRATGSDQRSGSGQQPVFTLTPQDVAGETNWIGRRSADLIAAAPSITSACADQVIIYHRGLSGDEIYGSPGLSSSGVASGSCPFTPLWAAEGDDLAHFGRNCQGRRSTCPWMKSLAHPISATTTLYRNLAGANASGASCTGDHCPQPAGNSPVGAAISFDGQDDFIQLPETLLQGDIAHGFRPEESYCTATTSQRIFSLPRWIQCRRTVDGWFRNFTQPGFAREPGIARVL
ncbi:MAG: hypothetical protein R2856_38390 [Caldilineaceae bacterium]